MENNKYCFTGKTKINNFGVELQQIKYLKQLEHVNVGDLGGWIESENNFSNIDNSVILENVEVFNNAKVSENCWILGNCQIYDNAKIFGNAVIIGKARIFGNAKIYDHVLINGNCYIFDNSNIYGFSKIFDNAQVYGNSEIFGNAIIKDNAMILDSKVYDDAIVSTNVVVSEYSKIFKKAKICNNVKIFNEAIVTEPIVSINYNFKSWTITLTDNLLIIGCKAYSYQIWERIVKFIESKNYLKKTFYKIFDDVEASFDEHDFSQIIDLPKFIILIRMLIDYYRPNWLTL